MTDIMVDLETLGRKPGCVILSIGAVTFDGAHSFECNIDPESAEILGFHTDPETVKWWSEQSEQAKARLLDNRLDIITALLKFNEWYIKTRKRYSKFWCQGANFDDPILSEAMRMVGIKPAWEFWEARDTRTLYDVCKFNAKSVKREGTYHSALDDAKHQLVCVQEALKCI